MKRQTAFWTRERITQSVVDWFDQHGEPPRSVEWGIATETTPHRATVIAMFGSWNACIVAAGLQPVDRRGWPLRCPHCGEKILT